MDESLTQEKTLKKHWRKEPMISKTKIPVPLTACFNWNVMFSPQVSQILFFVAYFSSNFEKFRESSSLFLSAVLPMQLNSEVQITVLERKVTEAG